MRPGRISHRSPLGVPGWTGLLLAWTRIVAAEPLRDEDVVRLFAEGRSSEAIVAEIESREVDFDLSAEMLDELRQAGLPAPVIEAMRRRHEQLHPTPPAPAAVEPVAPPLRLHVVRAGARAAEEPPRVRVRSRVEPGLAAALELEGSEPGTITDVALFVADLDPEHVPDHWRAASPLGRDFVSMPRHKLLGFLAGARAGDGWLELELARTIEVELEDAGAPHHLAVGLAVQIAGRYYRLTDARLDGFVAGTAGADVTLRLTGGPEPATLEASLTAGTPE